MMQRPVQFVGYALIFGLIGCAIRLASGPSGREDQVEVNNVHVNLVSPEMAVEHFSEILKFRTISSLASKNHVEKPEEFRKLHWCLRTQWLSVFKALEVQEVRTLVNTTASRSV